MGKSKSHPSIAYSLKESGGDINLHKTHKTYTDNKILKRNIKAIQKIKLNPAFYNDSKVWSRGGVKLYSFTLLNLSAIRVRNMYFVISSTSCVIAEVREVIYTASGVSHNKKLIALTSKHKHSIFFRMPDTYFDNDVIVLKSSCYLFKTKIEYPLDECH